MNPVWPSPLEKELLLACFAEEEEASAALRRCSSALAGVESEPAAMQLLPLVYRRWPDVENRAVELGRQAYFATWNRNRERMAQLGEITDRFGEEGIRWMALKGAALILRQHADLGVRGMSDLDVLIQPEDLGRAALLLNRSGYRAEEDATPEAVVRQARVRHAWQFFGEPDRNFDLHWRPVNRCYSPEVTRLFWENAETVRFGSREMLVPSPAEQLFHVCVHGLQWDWTRKIRWIADALSVLRDPIDWDGVYQLGVSARMSFRLANALEFLRKDFRAQIPPDLPDRLIRAAAKWECGEHRLLLKPCPLGFYDSFAWHAYHFRRIRPFDDGWRRAPLPVAWTRYLAAFLNTPALGSLWVKLRPQLMLRVERVIRRHTRAQP